MRLFLLALLGLIAILCLVYIFGPTPPAPVLDPSLPNLSLTINNVETFVNDSEKRVHNIKKDNQARIVWADSISKSRTPISIVYLHGYAASQGEGMPIHTAFAKRYGCNLYLARLYEHGLSSQEPLLNITPDKLLASAKEAVAIGKTIGEKVILMSTSTGGTLSLIIASDNPDILGLILYSPNIDLFDKKSWLLGKPWGLQIARTVLGGNYYSFNGPPGADKYWNLSYRLEALVALKTMLNASMNKNTFHKIHQPLFLGYYYKDEEHQDDAVSVKRMLEMFQEVGTPDQYKRKISFPNSQTHIIASEIWSKDFATVEKETYQFAEEVLKMNPMK